MPAISTMKSSKYALDIGNKIYKMSHEYDKLIFHLCYNIVKYEETYEKDDSVVQD